MNIKTGLVKAQCDRYREECNFTDSERAVFDLRVKGFEIVAISGRLNMSETTVSRRLKAIKKKIAQI